MNRETRRALKREAPIYADKLAKCCHDFQGDKLVQVTDPKAVAALRRAFRRMIEAGCKPVALPISEDEAQGFPRFSLAPFKAGAHWLAVGVDPENRGAYALQSAKSNEPAAAHDAAKEKALANLALICAAPGFPKMPDAQGGVSPHGPSPSKPCPVFGPRK